MLPPHSLEQVIQWTIREEWGRILASIAGSVGDLQLAEDCAQDAVERALNDWPQKGLPKSPSAWLITVARRKAVDRLRRDQTFSKKQQEIAQFLEVTAPDPDDLVEFGFPDKRLELIFTCCHPALAGKTQIALTLRTIGGLTTEEIAKAFLDDPRAIGQRLTRAKKKIRDAGIAYAVPDPEYLPGRLKAVLSVIYLIYNEGYEASKGADLTRVDMIDEAIRLCRIVRGLMPSDAEIEGLLALMLLNDARRLTRIDEAGQMVPLEHQNRARWDKGKIDEGRALVKTALARGQIGSYQLQAAISALHSDAASWEATDWPQIMALYSLLHRIQPTPVIAINKAMAASYARSPEKALEMLDQIAEQADMTRYQPYLVARADVLRRMGKGKDAKACLEQAIDLTENEVERRFLSGRLLASHT